MGFPYWGRETGFSRPSSFEWNVFVGGGRRVSLDPLQFVVWNIFPSKWQIFIVGTGRRVSLNPLHFVVWNVFPFSVAIIFWKKRAIPARFVAMVGVSSFSLKIATQKRGNTRALERKIKVHSYPVARQM